VRKIGIIGGGQLGRMTIEEAGKYGAQITVLAPEWPCPAGDLAEATILGKLTDREAILELGSVVDVVSYEIEHVSVEALRELETGGKLVVPSSAVLALIQDKAAQKRLWDAAGLPTAAWRLVEGEETRRPALEEAVASLGGWPVVQKARRGGYDGQGVRVLTGPSSGFLEAASLVEAKVDFTKELAVVVLRDALGHTAAYPCVEMVFDPRARLCDSVLAPADEPASVLARAEALALACVDALGAAAAGAAGAVGVFGVEMFLTSTGEILINEVAPRPHNSGHFTIEACVSSQFDQYLRILLGLPLGSTELLSPAMMVNLVAPAEEGRPGPPAAAPGGELMYEGLEKALALPSVAIHIYGKRELRPFRKMGHLTALGKTAAEARERAEAAAAAIRIRTAENR
jgi:5-(carboxyamino)imidazole ribonucleotide synthase